MPIDNPAPVLDDIQVSAANPNRDGTGTIVDAIIAGQKGTAISEIRVVAVGTTTDGMIRIFTHNGTAYRLLDEFPVTALVPSATVKGFMYVWTPPAPNNSIGFPSPLIIDSGWKLGIATLKAEVFNIYTKSSNI